MDRDESYDYDKLGHDHDAIPDDHDAISEYHEVAHDDKIHDYDEVLCDVDVGGYHDDYDDDDDENDCDRGANLNRLSQALLRVENENHLRLKIV
jgi:hypothetical protein